MKNYNEKKRFSIRKYAVGVVSIVTGITIFIGDNKHMPQKTNQQINTPSHSNETTQTAQKNLKENESRPSESELPSSKLLNHSNPNQRNILNLNKPNQLHPLKHNKRIQLNILKIKKTLKINH